MVGPERGGTSSAGDSGRGREPRRWQEPWLHHTEPLNASELQLKMAGMVRFELRILQFKNTVREAPALRLCVGLRLPPGSR